MKKYLVAALLCLTALLCLSGPDAQSRDRRVPITAGGGDTPYAFVATADAFAAGANTEITLSSTLSAGENVIVLCLSGASGGAAPTMVDAVNSYDQCGTMFTSGGLDYTLFYARNVASGTPTMNCTFSASVTNRSIAYWRYANLGDAACQDGNAGLRDTDPGTGTDAINSNNVTPSSQPAMVWGITIGRGGGVVDPVSGTGFTSRGTIGTNWEANLDNGTNIEDKRVTSTSATNCTWTGTGWAGTDDADSMCIVVSE